VVSAFGWLLRYKASRLREINLITLVIAGSFLAGCSANGDFGEIKPWLARDDIHDWVATDATGAIPSSRFELTDDERQLRDLAYPLVEPPWLRHTPTSIAREYGASPGQYHSGNDTTAYAANLASVPRVSPVSRYARLTDDIRNDTTRLPQFFETAARVVDLDGKRRKSFAYISVTSEAERRDAARRMNENAAIIAQVRRSLGQRVASYKFALERLVIMTPSPQAVESEQMLNQLRAVIARYRNGAPLARNGEGSLARIND
jgi:hypothetical protein